MTSGDFCMFTSTPMAMTRVILNSDDDDDDDDSNNETGSWRSPAAFPGRSSTKHRWRPKIRGDCHNCRWHGW